MFFNKCFKKSKEEKAMKAQGSDSKKCSHVEPGSPLDILLDELQREREESIRRLTSPSTAHFPIIPISVLFRK